VISSNLPAKNSSSVIDGFGKTVPEEDFEYGNNSLTGGRKKQYRPLP